MKKRSFLKIFLAFAFFAAPVSAFAGPRVAVLPWKVNSAEPMEFVKGAMVEMLSSRIGSSSLEVVSPDEVRSSASDKKEMTDSIAADIGRKLKADYVLYGSLTVFGSSISLDARLMNLKEGKASPLALKGTGMDSVIGLADKLSSDVVGIVRNVPQPALPVVQAAPAVKTEEGQTLAKEKDAAPKDGFIIKTQEAEKDLSQWKSSSIEGLYTGFAAADLDRDGKKEFFLITRSSLVIARAGEGKLEIIKEIKEPGVDNVAITAFDGDGDGSPEVYVSRVANNRPDSAVIDWKDGGYTMAEKGVRWLMRTIQDGNGPVKLIGQGFRRPDGFYGRPVVLKRDRGRVVEAGEFEAGFPRKVDLYRFDALDLNGKEGAELAALDDRQYIDVYIKDRNGIWKKDWKSTEYYGGTLNYLEFTGDGEKGSFPIEGRVLHADMDKNGKPELIIKRNVPGGFGRRAERPSSYTEGEVISLYWDGERLTESWRTKKVTGYISDFLIEDLDGDGNPEITLLVVEGTEKFTDSAKSYILSHKIGLQ